MTWVPHKRMQLICIQCKPNKQFLISFQTMVMKKFEETIAAKDSTENGNSSSFMEEISNKKQRIEGPFVMPLISIPKHEEQSSNASIVLSGTAKKGEIGPPLGIVDIGVSKSAYFFQVALPGVKKDPGQFSCEIERGGMVHVRGETSTGGNTVTRHSRVFEMKFQQQSPPGQFSLSFSLPGPVDPRLFYPNFRSDGIFEAIVMKCEE